MGGCKNEIIAKGKRPWELKLQKFEPQSKNVLDYSPKYKINIIESVLPQLNGWMYK
jgi:hypothetical protein